MPSDSSWRPAPVRFDPPSHDRVHRHDVVDAPDRRAISFAREKFVWLDQVRADPELTPLAFMLAYLIANLVNEREGYPKKVAPADATRAFPRGMVPNIRTYVEGTLLVIGDQALSPEILTAAILRIWRKDRFPPTIAQLLDECDHALQGAANARRVVAKMIALLDNAEEVLIATGDFEGGRQGIR